MKFASFLAAVGIASLANAQTDEEKADYQLFAQNMGIYGYGWEPIKVKTEDGYTLTMMHVTGKKTVNENGEVVTVPGSGEHGPILIQSSLGTSPDIWLEYYFLTNPLKNAMPLQLYEDGFDVYFSFSRGTEPSREHEKYDVMQKEFWDWSWYELGKYDTKAQYQVIYERDPRPISYIGYSMGTTQMFSAMITEYDYFSQHANKIAMLAPCTVTAEYMYSFIGKAFVSLASMINLFVIGGPDWYLKVPTMANIIGREGILGLLAGGWGTRLLNTSTKSIFHYAQNSQQNTFQTYSDSYWNILFPKKETTPINLSDDKVIPVGMFIGADEDTCLIPQSDINRDLLGPMAQFYKIYPGENHVSFVSKNDQEFYDDLLGYLTSPHPTAQETFLQ